MNKGILSVLFGALALGAVSDKFKGSKSRNFRPNSKNWAYIQFSEGIWNFIGKKHNDLKDIEYLTVHFENPDMSYLKGMKEVSRILPNVKGLEITQTVPDYINFIGLFPKLEELSMGYCDSFVLNFQQTGTYIPKEITQNKKITKLSLYECDFPEFPKELSEMTNLTYLNLSSNYFMFNNRQVAEQSFRRLKKLVNLEHLLLVRTGLNIIPDEIINLQNLRKLVLNHNEIQYIPRDIVKMKNLTDLRLSYNQISNFPDYLCDLINLRRIDIDNTLIKELPNHFGNLTNLVIFNFSDTTLKCPSRMQAAIWISQGFSQDILSKIVRRCRDSKSTSELRRF